MIKKASGKTGRKRPAKKEFLIPVHVVGQANKEILPKEKEEVFDTPSGGKNFPKIIEDENNLPVFAREEPEIDHGEKDRQISEEQTAQIIREQRKAAVESRKPPVTEKKERVGRTGGWSLAKKKTVMWASVAAVMAVIFFVWLSVIGKNLSLNLGSSSYTYLRNSANNEGLDESLNNLQDQWAELGEYLENKNSVESGEQALEKLKEKILVEEMKNKIEN